MWRGRPLWAEIDLDALAHNVRELRRRMGPGPELLAVVKANAYGHGAVPVAEAALEAGASRLGVAFADEGIQLRQAGIQCPILILGYSLPWEAANIVSHSLTPTVTTKQLALALSRLSVDRGAVTPVHVKVDTGLNRFGLAPGEVEGFVEFLRSLPGLQVEGLYTHFAVADEEDKAFTFEQFQRFQAVTVPLPTIPLRHVANSAIILDLPHLALDMVRAGISIYGLYPSREVSRLCCLQPVLSLKSLVARLHWLQPGDTVSYGRTWRAERPIRIALVPCGYADGYQRNFFGKASVLIRGQRAPVLGRIAMDQFMVDVTHVPDVALNDEVVIIGRQGDDVISVEELADLAGTINYEIVTGLSARVPRVYLKGGRVVKVQTLLGSVSPCEGEVL